MARQGPPGPDSLRGLGQVAALLYSSSFLRTWERRSCPRGRRHAAVSSGRAVQSAADASSNVAGYGNVSRPPRYEAITASTEPTRDAPLLRGTAPRHRSAPGPRHPFHTLSAVATANARRDGDCPAPLLRLRAAARPERASAPSRAAGRATGTRRAAVTEAEPGRVQGPSCRPTQASTRSAAHSPARGSTCPLSTGPAAQSAGRAASGGQAGSAMPRTRAARAADSSRLAARSARTPCAGGRAGEASPPRRQPGGRGAGLARAGGGSGAARGGRAGARGTYGLGRGSGRCWARTLRSPGPGRASCSSRARAGRCGRQALVTPGRAGPGPR